MICTHCGRDTDEPTGTTNKFTHLELIVCGYFSVTPDELIKKDRHQKYVRARQCIYYFSRKYLGITLRFLAARYRVDHTSVIHSTQTVKNCLFTEDYIFHDIQHLDYEIRKNVLRTESIKVA